MVEHLLGLGLVVAVGITAYYLLRYPHRGLKDLISVHGLGRLEGELANLRQVIVVADHVEDPTDELRAAVKKNFERQVRYQFLVSQSKARQELEGYYRIFETLAGIVGSRSAARNDLISIQQLPYDWVEVPYVFYQIEDQNVPSGIRYVAVRGNQRLEGIADFYTYVEPRYAHMVARAILTDAPAPITVEREQFARGNVIELERTVRSRQA